MGTGKKEGNRKVRQGKTGDGMGNVKVKGENFYRDAKKVKTLNMFKDGKAQRNAAGDITKAASFQSKDTPNARIEPNRKWFTNTRVIAQDSLAQFRDAVAKNQSDPYSYLLKQNKLPMSLIRDDKTKNGLKQHDAKMAIETRPYDQAFGPKSQRKRVKLGVSSLEDLAGASTKMHEEYQEKRDQADLLSGRTGELEQQEKDDATGPTGELTSAVEPIFSKGQSKRIWNELYKVIDSSDVVIHVLDARDPEGTRCRSVEKYIREEAPHKHLLFVLNKCDLVPTAVTAKWVKHLSLSHPTLAFHASINNSFGKGSLIAVLRQFSALHSSRKQISVGFIGYPNTGKSSIINTLRKKKVCTVAPIPGETKVWQYITLMKRIYLIDCPGVVPPSQQDTPEDILLRGVVRVENVENPEQYVAAALKKCKEKHVLKTYALSGYRDHIDFLEQLGRKGGRLLKGGETDVDGVAKMVLNDFLRGKIPWFTAPPSSGEEAAQDGDAAVNGQAKPADVEARTGDLARANRIPIGELRKRKRDEGDVGKEDDAVTEATEVTEDLEFPDFSDEDEDEDEDEDLDVSGSGDKGEGLEVSGSDDDAEESPSIDVADEGGVSIVST